MRLLESTTARRRLLHALPLVLVALLVGVAISSADGPAVTGTSVTLAPDSNTTALPGFSVSGYLDPSENLLTSVSTTLGTISLGETSGLTLAYGYTTFTDAASVSFTGTETDVSTALASLSLTGSGTSGTAAVEVTVTADPDTTMAYLPATGHYYEYVAAPDLEWTQAEADAAALSFGGQSGYLATIPSETVNAFIEAHLDGASDVWAGGHSVDYPNGYDGDTNVKRVWSWQGGPLAGTIFDECSNVSGTCDTVNDTSLPAGYTDWNEDEPNNDGYVPAGHPGGMYDPGEHQLEINYMGGGMWNDLGNTNDEGLSGYVVEFGNQATGGDATGVYSVTSDVALAGAPDAPTDVAVSPGVDSATVTWNAPDSDGGAPISGYTVVVEPGGELCTTATTSCTVTGLDSGTAYTFTVVAKNAMDTGPASAVSLPVTPVAPPVTPAAPTPTPAPTTTVTPPSPAVYTHAIAQGVCRVMRHDVLRLRSLSMDTNTSGSLVEQVWSLAPRDAHATGAPTIAQVPTVLRFHYHGDARTFLVRLTVTNSAGLSSSATIRCMTTLAVHRPRLTLTLPAAKFFVGDTARLTHWGYYYVHRRVRRLLRRAATVRALGQTAPGASVAARRLALARAKNVLAVLGLHETKTTTAARGRANARVARAHRHHPRVRARTRAMALPGYGPSVRVRVTYLADKPAR